MCGIFGFVSEHGASPLMVVDGLRKLEYRGYDSWGVASLTPAEVSVAGEGDGHGGNGAVATANTNHTLRLLKRTGKISRTQPDELAAIAAPAPVVIGHTRWATHGKPDQTNAHPHTSHTGRITLVHNGIVENHAELRGLLQAKGIRFVSETDTEVVAHLLDDELSGGADFHDALSRTLLQLHGAFGMLIVDRRQPDRLFAVRMGSPLVVGLTGQGRTFVSSDAGALVEHTREVIYLEDGEYAEVTAAGEETFDFHRSGRVKTPEQINFDLAAAELGNFEHYMLKEIYEQPNAMRDVLRGRLLHGDATVHLAGLEEMGEKLPTRIMILACGTSWHAALMARHYFEEIARVPTVVEYASEFRYRNAVVEPDTMVIAMSQSGETADTLAGLRESIRQGATPFGIVNVVGSSIARACGRGVFLHAGPEFGVAATKSFTNMLLVVLMMAIYFGRLRRMPLRVGLDLLRALEDLPEQAEKTLELDMQCKEIATQYVDAHSFLYIGRALEYPMALEGALKLKEVSYIHAEGLPAAELKHGPIALIDEAMPVVVTATQSFILDKVASNVQEIRARGGRIIVITSVENHEFDDLADHVLRVPTTHDLVSPILAAIPGQLLAYHLAALRGCDVDQPRNLAKSVTVE